MCICVYRGTSTNIYIYINATTLNMPSGEPSELTHLIANFHALIAADLFVLLRSLRHRTPELPENVAACYGATATPKQPAGLLKRLPFSEQSVPCLV